MSEQTWKPIPFGTPVESEENMTTKPKKQEVPILSPITRSGSTIGSAITNGQDNGIVNTGESPANGVLGKRHTSVSFNIPPTNLSQSYHRHSISSKLNIPRSSQEKGDTIQGGALSSTTDQHGILSNDGKDKNVEGKSQNGDKTDGDEVQDTEELPDEDKDCALHMPGDFIYIKPDEEEQEEEKGITTTEENNKPKLSNKIVFNKDEYCPTNDVEIDNEKDDSKFHILIGATGSVAAIKIPLIIDRLFKIYSHDTISIQLILTKPAEHFLNGLKIPRDVHIWREDDMKSRWWDFNNSFVSQMDDNTNNKESNNNNNNNKRKDDLEPLLFHELSRWADIFLIAPLSANSLAKLANGICNNLITSVVRDWNTKKTPIIVAPAMNTFMYINPMTKKHLLMLKEDFPTLEILKPIEKVLICGDIGMGGMREWSDITENIRLKIKEIHRKRHENEVDNEDQEIEEIDKDLAEDNEDEDEDEDEDEEDCKNTGEEDEDDEDDDDEDNDEDDDDEDDDEE